LEDLTKLNNEYIQFKITNNKKRGKKKKFYDFIRTIATVSVEHSENEDSESKMDILLSPKNGSSKLKEYTNLESNQEMLESKDQQSSKIQENLNRSASIKVQTIEYRVIKESSQPSKVKYLNHE
jgi:hypothetical protein